MNTVKEKLQKNEATFGTWQMIGNATITEILCQSGYEWVAVDMEHTANDVSVSLELIRTISLCGKVPAVRISENDPTIIKRVLDCGAKILIVPMVMNASEAQRIVDAAYYPPRGKRGVGLFRAQEYGYGFEGYKDSLEKDIVIVPQIEHIEAINNLEEIIKVPGIDATMIGPYDLSGSLGKPGDFDNPEFKKVISYYEEICNRNGKPMGYHIVKPTRKDVEAHIDKGYKFIALGFDSFFLGDKSRNVLRDICGE